MHATVTMFTDIRCARPNRLRNGQIAPFRTDYGIGDSIRFKCRIGYRLVGDEESTCTLTSENEATFTPDIPTCESKLLNHTILHGRNIWERRHTEESWWPDRFITYFVKQRRNGAYPIHTRYKVARNCSEMGLSYILLCWTQNEIGVKCRKFFILYSKLIVCDPADRIEVSKPLADSVAGWILNTARLKPNMCSGIGGDLQKKVTWWLFMTILHLGQSQSKIFPTISIGIYKVEGLQMHYRLWLHHRIVVLGSFFQASIMSRITEWIIQLWFKFR